MLITVLYVFATYILMSMSISANQGEKGLKFFILFVFGTSIVFLIENSLRSIVKYDLRKKNE